MSIDRQETEFSDWASLMDLELSRSSVVLLHRLCRLPAATPRTCFFGSWEPLALDCWNLQNLASRGPTGRATWNSLRHGPCSDPSFAVCVCDVENRARRLRSSSAKKKKKKKKKKRCQHPTLTSKAFAVGTSALCWTREHQLAISSLSTARLMRLTGDCPVSKRASAPCGPRLGHSWAILGPFSPWLDRDQNWPQALPSAAEVSWLSLNALRNEPLRPFKISLPSSTPFQPALLI